VVAAGTGSLPENDDTIFIKQRLKLSFHACFSGSVSGGKAMGSGVRDLKDMFSVSREDIPGSLKPRHSRPDVLQYC